MLLECAPYSDRRVPWSALNDRDTLNLRCECESLSVWLTNLVGLCWVRDRQQDLLEPCIYTRVTEITSMYCYNSKLTISEGNQMSTRAVHEQVLVS